VIDEKVKLWFPLRIRHSSDERLTGIKEELEKEETVDEVYVPTTFMKTSPTSMDFAPMFSNVLFIRTTLSSLRQIKSQREKYERIRYFMHSDYDEDYNKHPEIVHITDKKMEDVKTIINNANDKVIFLNNMNFACKPGQNVQITQGPFAGVVGILKSFKKHLCVVVPIGEVGAVAVTYVPKKHLVYLPDDKKY
jgi:transcription antitermination factor NusG